jgi:hypothetical protein
MFSCRVGDTNLCFSGSVCATSETGADVSPNYCKCPPGYGADRFFFHDPNCSMPDVVPVIFFTIFSLVTFVGLMILRADSHLSRNTVRQAVHIAAMFVVCLWAQAATFYLQEGNYEGSTFFASLCTIFGSLWFDRVLLITAVPLFQMNHNVRTRVTLLLRVICFTCAGAAGVFGLAMMTTCRYSDVVFNTVVLTNFSVLLGLLQISMAALVWFSSSLLDVMDTAIKTRRDLTESQSLSSPRDKLHAFKWQVNMFRASLLIMIGPWLIAHAYLGSAPYSWVFFMANMLGNAVNIVRASHILARTTPHSSQEVVTSHVGVV